MNFKKWYENLEFDSQTEPSEITKKIWVNQPNNKEQIDKWKKHNTRKFFKFPLNKEKFIHFTLSESVPEILNTKKLGYGNAGVFAVSCSFGEWIPIVQFNHIISKNKNKKFIQPYQLRNKIKVHKLKKIGYEIPKFNEEISAIIFETNEIPYKATVEEVAWEKEIDIFNCKEIDTRMAINILKNTKYKIDQETMVKYY